jgi:hypothetical protein
MNETPYCFALLMADFIQRDASRKWTLVGVFDRLTFAKFPSEVSVGVFFGIVDGRGELPVKFQIVNIDDEFDDSTESEPVGVAEDAVNLPSPLAVLQAAVSIPVLFPHAGAYNLEMWVNHERIQSRRLIVTGPPAETDI